MKQTTLHLDRKDFWRYPLDRALLSPLLKDSSISLLYEKEPKIWKLNGEVLLIINQKVYSKIMGMIFCIFHQIRCCFSKEYSKNFKMAKIKIDDALLKAQKIEERHLKQIFDRKTAINHTISEAEKSKTTAAEIVLNVKAKKIEALHRLQNENENLINKLQEHENLIDLFEGLDEAIKCHEGVTKDAMISKINETPQFQHLELEDLTNSGILRILEHQRSCQELIEEELKNNEVSQMDLIRHLEELSSKYQDDVRRIENQFEEISQSPIKNSSSKRNVEPKKEVARQLFKEF